MEASTRDRNNFIVSTKYQMYRTQCRADILFFIVLLQLYLEYNGKLIIYSILVIMTQLIDCHNIREYKV